MGRGSSRSAADGDSAALTPPEVLRSQMFQSSGLLQAWRAIRSRAAEISRRGLPAPVDGFDLGETLDRTNR